MTVALFGRGSPFDAKQTVATAATLIDATAAINVVVVYATINHGGNTNGQIGTANVLASSAMT